MTEAVKPRAALSRPGDFYMPLANIHGLKGTALIIEAAL
jgi:hypothetical protein